MKKTGAVSATASRYRRKELALRMILIIHADSITAESAFNSTALWLQANERSLRIAKRLTDLNLRDKLCLMSCAMSMAVIRRILSGLGDGHGFLKLRLPSYSVRALAFQESCQ